MPAPPYLLDTNVLVALIRGKDLGIQIDTAYDLRHQLYKHLISAVTKGEIRSLARQFGWSPDKRQELARLLMNDVVSLEIDQPAIMDAYEEIDCFSLHLPTGAHKMGKNDLWIAATAKATGAILLTTDKDFDHLDPAHLKRIYIDPGTALAGPPGEQATTDGG